jgi:hypothetical protein
MRLNPVTRNSVQIQKLSIPLFIFVILILPVVAIVRASLVAATLVRDADDQKMSAYSRQVADDIQSERKLAEGKFLVADRGLMDPNFRETGVLLIRYGLDGTIGLVINRPLQLNLSTVLPDIKELDRRKETLYLGGPVEPTRLLLLVRSANLPEASMPVFGDVYSQLKPKSAPVPDKTARQRRAVPNLRRLCRLGTQTA